MSTVTLASLRTQVRQRADIVNSTFISTAELTGYINAAARELHDLLISAWGADYYITSSGIALAPGTDTYSLPGDFYKLAGVDLGSGTETRSLRRHNFSERNNRRGSRSYSAGYFPYDPTYRHQLNSIVVSPAQNSGTLTVWYHPTMTPLVDDSDTFDGVNGWEEYIIVDAAIRCLQKEESDTRVFAQQKAELRERILSMADERNVGEALRIGDVSSDYDWY